MLQSLKNSFKINFESKQAKLCLIGVCLLNFGMGGVLIWGQVNIYFFSYFRHHNQQLNIAQSTMMLNLAVIPIAIGMIFSIPIAEKIGFSRLIKITSILYPIGTLLSSMTQDIYIFSLFYVIISCTAYSLNAMPVLNCLYSHFPKDTGKVSGFAFACNGIATFLYSIIAQKLINPNNSQADVLYNEGGQDINLFSEKIASNLPPCLFMLSIIYAIFCIPASFLITYNNKNKQNEEQINDYQNFQNEKYLNDSPSKFQQNNYSSEYQQNQNNINNELIKENELIVIAEFNDEQEQNQNNQFNFNIDLTRKNQDKIMLNEGNQFQSEESSLQISDQCPDIRTGLLSKPFQICFFITFLSSLYGVFLTFNYKLYGMTKINDDEFLTLLGGVNVVVGSLSNTVWGPAIDKLSKKKILSNIMIIYTVVGVCLPLTAHYKIFFLLFYCGIGILNNGLFTVLGPTFIKFFGLQVGTKLVPINSVAMFLSIFLMPILSFIVITYSNYDLMLIILGLFCILGSFVTKFLNESYTWNQIINQNC